IYIINADWYFNLHWMDRAIAASKIYDVFVVCPSNNVDFIKKCKANNIGFINFNMSRSGINPLKEIKSVLKLRNIIKSLSPDVIHAVTIKPNLYLSLLFPKEPGIVLTFAGLGTLRTSSGILGMLTMLFLKLVLARWNFKSNVRVLFENQEDMDFIASGISIRSKHCYRVYGAGVDLELYNVTDFPETTPPFILFASRMLKDKGLQELVKAIKILNSQGLACKLQVAGIIDAESPLAFKESDIENMSKSGDFVWLGKRDDIAQLISQSIIVCLPTRYGEGVPRILIEALSCGRPIVTSSYGGCKDVCIDGETGYIVDPENSNDLASALSKLIKQKMLAKNYGLNGRKLVEEKFSNEIIIRQHLEFYSVVSGE
ncbi:glycosyltransferase family 4 protein, partial [Vibrio aestuarianus]|uniref:glycosyltransferase family 4 protein n=1 Tax=Vibrio aestuarianus TaxID=28171 RepID=UPI00237C7135